jgi:hypothetical protein
MARPPVVLGEGEALTGAPSATAPSPRQWAEAPSMAAWLPCNPDTCRRPETCSGPRGSPS